MRANLTSLYLISCIAAAGVLAACTPTQNTQGTNTSGSGGSTQSGQGSGNSTGGTSSSNTGSSGGTGSSGSTTSTGSSSSGGGGSTTTTTTTTSTNTDPLAICGPFTEYNSTTFTCMPAGEIVNGKRTDVVGNLYEFNWVPDMRFPLQSGPAYVNSLFYRYKWGGGFLEDWIGPDGVTNLGPTSGDCTASNYQYPWQDNMCEIRPGGNGNVDACPAGIGHKGLDIRGAVCAPNDPANVVVAPFNGWIVSIAPNNTKILHEDENLYANLMHMHIGSQVYGGANQSLPAGGIWVERGDVLGRIGKVQRGLWDGTITTPTPSHLHFELRIAEVDPVTRRVAANGEPVSAYASLVDAYQRLDQETD